ncbi:MAG: hypothetical protein V1801_03045 [Candidatus Falkowbacteria bacterium]
MANNLDGIKKLNPEEIKKNRKIVLSYIGEKEPELIKELKAMSLAASVFNKVDGIKSNRISSLNEKVKGVLERPSSVKDVQASKQEEINLEKEKAKQEKIEREGLIKKEIAEKAEREAEEKKKAEEAKKLREKLRIEEGEREKRRIIEENKRLGKIKRVEEIKRIEQEVESAKIEVKKKRKIKRRKALKLFKENLNNKLSEIFSIVKQNFFYGTLYLITFLIIGYLVFCLLVLRFKVDNNIVGRVARILPVPAVVTNQGIINYYDFLDIKNNNYDNLNLAEKKNSLAKWLISRNLNRKYDLSVDLSSETLFLAFVADKEFNQVGLSRIKKISELLKNVDSIERLSKYADEYSDVIYYNSEDAIKKFGQTVINLSYGQISNVVLRDSGYYIIQAVDNKNGQLGIKYLFVGAKTLDQYISEKLTKIKIFILAN